MVANKTGVFFFSFPSDFPPRHWICFWYLVGDRILPLVPRPHMVIFCLVFTVSSVYRTQAWDGLLYKRIRSFWYFLVWWPVFKTGKGSFGPEFGTQSLIICAFDYLFFPSPCVDRNQYTISPRHRFALIQFHPHLPTRSFSIHFGNVPFSKKKRILG